MRWGLRGRVRFMFAVVFCEGLALMLFSRITLLPLAIVSLIVFSLFVQMSEGATYAVVPFINRKALGAVTGIVGAGGNFGAVTAGFLFKGEMSWPTALLVLGVIVTAASFCAFLVGFSPAEEYALSNEGEAESIPLEGELTPAVAIS
jgi:NNP family nitrate/nitrite transporter-like MFS transporter